MGRVVGPLRVRSDLCRGESNCSALQLREPTTEYPHCTTTIREPWNKGKLVGKKAPFKLKEFWAIRVRLQLASGSSSPPKSPHRLGSHTQSLGRCLPK
jgi:hypothetical protein